MQFAGGYQLSGLLHFGARYYDPNLARWTQADPISHVSDLGQANAYAYVAGDPINLTDPSGADLLGDVVDVAESAGRKVLDATPGPVKETFKISGPLYPVCNAAKSAIDDDNSLEDSIGDAWNCGPGGVISALTTGD